MRFRTKLFLLLVTLSFLAMGLFALIVFIMTVQVPRNWATSWMGSTAVLMSKQIDPADVVAIRDDDGEERAAAYDRVLAQCWDVVNALDSSKTRFRLIDESVYLDVRSDLPGMGRTVVSTNTAMIGNEYVISRFPAFSKAWHEPSIQSRPLRDEYGYYFGAYAPIKDAQGQTVGVFGIDVNAEPFDYFRWTLLGFLVLGMMLAVLAAAVAAWHASRWISRPIPLLASAMRRVAEDDLSARMPDARTNDEFRQVAEGFNEMVAALQDRAGMKASLALASDIQRQLLPASPQLEGYDLGGQAVYCDESGGDYFDFIPLDPDETDGPRYWAVALGDVAGHGIGPALLMAWTRAAFRVAGPGRRDDLQGLFQFINRQLVRDTRSDRFITLFYAVLDTRTGVLHWSSAGHEPAVLIRAHGEVERLEATEVPLGVMDGLDYPPGEPIQLAPGDRLIVTSDGITQNRNAEGRFFGADGVAAVARRDPEASSQELCRQLIQAAQDYTGDGAIDDDLTAVALRVTG